MKNILLISYYFPPCTLTAGQRPYAWCRYLHRWGYRPIVITRKWEKEIRVFSDVNQLSAPGVEHELHEWGEVYRMPYAGNRRDRLMARYGTGRFAAWRRLLSLGELVFENLSLRAIPYRNFYVQARALIRQKDIKGVVISGGPFPQFFFGYKLHKTTGVPWLADYRDDWSTDEVNRGKGRLFRLLKKLNRRSEKKWLASAAAFTTISPHYRNKIGRLAPLPGYVVQNGYSEAETDGQQPLHTASHTLLYNGTLYPTQSVEPLLTALAAYNRTAPVRLQVHFPGLAVDEAQKNRVEQAAKKNGVEGDVSITARIPKAEIMQKQAAALALLMVGHTGLKGIPSSKIYEYLSLGKPIILFEPDGDILEEIVGGYNLGFIVGRPYGLGEIIEKITRMRQAGTLVADRGYINRFSRESQVAELARVMDKHFLP